MKSLYKRIVSRSVQNDFFWTILDSTILRLTRHVEWERQKNGEINKQSARDRVIYDAIKAAFPDLVVKHGVFKGMKYPQMKSVGSMLFPKLLGSYEKEIQPLMERICREGYTEIVDIGCAEGYYAVGLAMQVPTAELYAYDTNKEALLLCDKMAQLNNVDGRIVTGSFCDTETLKAIPFTRKALILVIVKVTRATCLPKRSLLSLQGMTF